MGQSSKKQFPLSIRGIDLNAPADVLREGFLPFIENYRRETDGSVTPRHGLGTGKEIIAGQSPVHSVRRLNDSSTGTVASTEIVGVGSRLATCTTDLSASAQVDTGYSGDPLNLLAWRPSQSTKPWMYAADRSRMRKVDQAGNVKQIGLPPPAAAPTAAIAAPTYNVLDEFNDHTLWAAAGTAVAKANHTRVDAATRSITAIKYDSGTTGWACVRPNTLYQIGEGTRLTINTGGGTQETVTVEQVFRGATSTTIAAIAYEGAGGPGICSIHLATPVMDIEVDSMLLLNGSEYVRVLSIHTTTDGLLSFRCATTATFAVGNTVLVVPSFRAYFANTHAAAETIAAAGVQFTANAAGSATLTRTVALDLSLLATGLPTRPQDYMHLDLYVDRPDLVSEIKVYLDIDATPGTFTDNYLMKVLRANDLTALTVGQQTAIANDQIRFQRNLITGRTRTPFDPYVVGEEPVSDPIEDPSTEAQPPGMFEQRNVDRQNQIDAGQNQWSSLKWRLSEMLTPDIGRIGADYSRSLKDVGALKIVLITTGIVIARLDGWWIGCGYGPDVTVAGRHRIYRYRGRDSSTGVVSNWSPAIFGGVRPKRQKVNVSLPTHPSAEVDKLDVQVYGGELLGWHYAGATDNGVGVVFEDTYSEEDLARLGALPTAQENYQLWPQIRPPVSGLSAICAGNLVSIFGFGSINVNTAPGTAFKVGGKDVTLHSVLSTTKFYVYESVGLASGSWEAPEPLIVAQPLAGFAGPFFNFCFGWGDPYNPWRLYYTNGNDPDTTRDSHYIDVEGETLVGMVILEDSGRAILFSSESAFLVEPSFTLAKTGGGLFSVRRIPDAPGLFSMWACCDADGEAVYLSKDGVYATTGGNTRVISSDLRPIFPKGQSMGVATNGVKAPNMTAANITKFAMSYANRELFFDYIDIDGAYRTLVNEKGDQDDWLGWILHTYTPGVTRHYSEEGKNVAGTLACGADGKLFRLARAQADSAGAAIAASLLTPDHHFGDARMSKYILDSMIDADRDGATIVVTPAVNHRASVQAATNITAGAGRAQTTIDLNSGQGLRGKDISLSVAASVTTERPKIYLYEFTFSGRPDSSLLRGEDYELKQQGAFWCRGAWIYADTSGVNRAALFEYTNDEGDVTSVAISAINHDTLTERYYAFESPMYLIAARVRPTDAAAWEFAGFRLEGEPAPPKSPGPTAWDGDAIHARFVQGVVFDIDTAGVAIDMRVEVDNAALQTTINAAANKGPITTTSRAQVAYSFDEPFITHLIRFNPSAGCRIFGVNVIFEPEPESAWMWWTQQSDLGADGFKFLGDGYLSIRSTANIILEIIADGVSHFPTFYDASTNSSNARRKYRFRCPVIKAKSFEFKVYSATAAGRVAVFQKDFQLEFKPWGSEGGWQTINPLGDIHYQSGARI